MKKKQKNLLIWGSLGVFVVGAIGYSIYVSQQPGQHDAFAQCLTDEGATFYGAFWCPHCNSQKRLFGNSESLVNYVECSTPDRSGQLEVCREAGIESYPTWEFADGSRLNGQQPLEVLAEKTGCTL